MKTVIATIRVIAILFVGAVCLGSPGQATAGSQEDFWTSTLAWTTAELTGDAVSVRKCITVVSPGMLQRVTVVRSGGTGASVDVTITDEDVDPVTTTDPVHLSKVVGITAEKVYKPGISFEGLKESASGKPQICITVKSNGGTNNFKMKMTGIGINRKILG